MKKTKQAFLLLLITFVAKSQVNWTTDLISPSANTANIGTMNDRSFNIFTNNSKRFTIDSLGGIKSSTLQGNGYRLVFADENGYIGTMSNRPVGGGSANSYPCTVGSSPWFEGGNTLGNIGTFNQEIGTCNNKNFILKANDKKAIHITAQDGFVGLGATNTSASALLDIWNPSGSNTQHLRIYGDQTGWIEATGDLNLTYSGSFNLNNNFNIDASNRILIGSGSISGNTKFTINSGVNDCMQNQVSSNTVKAFNVYNSAASKENFVVYGDGKTTIGSETGATNVAFLNINVSGGSTPSEAINLWDQYSGKINFKIKSNGQTIIGNQTNAINSAFFNLNVAGSGTGSNSENVIDVFEQSSGMVNFRVKSSGNVYCRELEVLPTTFPDYVFEKDYNLLPLDKLKAEIFKNKRLNGFNNANEYLKNGMKVSEIIVKQQEKIEELYLYLIELNEKYNCLQNSIKPTK